MSNTATASKPATKRAPRKATSSAATSAAPKPAFEVFTEIPKRQYTLSGPAAHQDFFDEVRKVNEGKSGDERVYLVFPKSKKGVASAIKNGAYRAAPKGQFTARTRTVDGEFKVLVTVADQA